MSTDPTRNQTIAATCHQALAEFYKLTGISPEWKPSVEREEVTQLVRKKLATFDMGNVPAKRWERHMQTSLDIATTAYAHTHRDVQVHVTIFTTLTICVDDLDVEARCMEEFGPRMLRGERQAHPLLDRLVENLLAGSEYFSPYVATAITASTVQFVAATALDSQIDNMPIEEGGSMPYVHYKRERNGLAEAYSGFIWEKRRFPDVSEFIQTIPDGIFYLNHVNDVFSFYKEEIAGETANFIHDRATATQRAVPEVLSLTVTELGEAVNRSRRLLKSEEGKKVWDSFTSGYAMFHLYSPRYRLHELTGLQLSGSAY